MMEGDQSHLNSDSEEEEYGYGFGEMFLKQTETVKKGPGLKLAKQQSWSNETYRDQAWMRRKDQWKLRKSKSLTDEDLDELRGCIDLGFGFDLAEKEPDKHLCDTLPALDLYYAIHRQFREKDLKAKPSPIDAGSGSGSGAGSGAGSPNAPPLPSDGDHSECSSCPDDNNNNNNAGDSSPCSWIISSPGDTPQLIKTRLRHWAQVVACSVRQSC
eukprot:TRINITY_DN4587_c0_g1_i1.p1 TRINITY_DN4587_c0_g1~~TRINITY_DN4587_c0_g1_i1.p1  ORF type:complete len:214 (-),score=42.24 TRINITY_DN4587_c0_g1_i1:491-1132(-)